MYIYICGSLKELISPKTQMSYKFLGLVGLLLLLFKLCSLYLQNKLKDTADFIRGHSRSSDIHIKSHGAIKKCSQDYSLPLRRNISSFLL